MQYTDYENKLGFAVVILVLMLVFSISLNVHFMNESTVGIYNGN